MMDGNAETRLGTPCRNNPSQSWFVTKPTCVARLMSEPFHVHIQVLRSKNYAKRAQECRSLARICPEHLRESYLRLAAEYEQFATEADEKRVPVSSSI
jgi:hypothetical protein